MQLPTQLSLVCFTATFQVRQNDKILFMKEKNPLLEGGRRLISTFTRSICWALLFLYVRFSFNCWQVCLSAWQPRSEYRQGMKWNIIVVVHMLHWQRPFHTIFLIPFYKSSFPLYFLFAASAATAGGEFFSSVSCAVAGLWLFGFATVCTGSSRTVVAAAAADVSPPWLYNPATLKCHCVRSRMYATLSWPPEAN